MTKKHFIYEPYEITYYSTEQKWKDAIESFDHLGNYCDEGWDEEVTNVCAGIIPDGVTFDTERDEASDFFPQYATHETKEYNRRERPDEAEIDAEGFDKDGQYWGVGETGWTWICSHGFFEKLKEDK